MSRRPAPRRRTITRRRRRNLGGEALLAGFLVLALAVLVLRWVADHMWVLAVPTVPAAVAGGVWANRQRRRAQLNAVRLHGLRYVLPELDALHHRQFEHAVRDLMHRDGCPDARQVGGANDNGADVIATDPQGRRWVIQCKHRRQGLAGTAVGTPDLQVLNGTARQLHQADVVVLVTNGRFSGKCPAFAHSQRIHLVDRDLLARWSAGTPVWDLLSQLPPPRRPTPLS